MAKNIHPELLEYSRKIYGNECELTILPESLSKNSIGWCAIQEDLKQILSFLSSFRLDLPDVVYPSLTYAIVGLYRKCFTDASGSKYPKLEPNDVFKNRPDLLLIHNELMDLRHRFLAHRGSTYANQAILVFYTPDNNGIPNGIKYIERKLNRMSEDRLLKNESLINFLLSSVNEKILKKGEALYNKIFQDYSEFDFNQMPKIPKKPF